MALHTGSFPQQDDFSQILKKRVRVSLNGKHPVFCREPRIRVPKNHAEGPGRLKLP